MQNLCFPSSIEFIPEVYIQDKNGAVVSVKELIDELSAEAEVYLNK